MEAYAYVLYMVLAKRHHIIFLSNYKSQHFQKLTQMKLHSKQYSCHDLHCSQNLHSISFLKCKTKQSDVAAQHANLLMMKTSSGRWTHLMDGAHSPVGAGRNVTTVLHYQFKNELPSLCRDRHFTE